MMSPRKNQEPIAAVRDYYERNTALFLALGRERRARTIHRAVWAAGTRSLAAALNYTNDCVLAEVVAAGQRRPGPVRVLDLGCGVGGSLLYLGRRCPAPLWAAGVTISPLQARLARREARRQRLNDRCVFVEADFLHLPARGAADVAFAIEAFAHSPDPQRFFAQAATALAPAGRLLLCDDFLAADAGAPGVRTPHAWLRSFQQGWLAPGLCTPAAATAMARSCGLRLVSDRDLTAGLRLAALPDGLAATAVGLAARLGRLHPFWRSLAGSLALQQCLRHGLVRYRWMVFHLQPDA